MSLLPDFLCLNPLVFVGPLNKTNQTNKPIMKSLKAIQGIYRAQRERYFYGLVLYTRKTHVLILIDNTANGSLHCIRDVPWIIWDFN